MTLRPINMPIQQGRSAEGIIQHLKDSIILGKYKPGQKLPSEKELTDQFKVSRIVVREAIRTLEIYGFITLRCGSTGGAYVTNLSFLQVGTAIMDLFLTGRISIPEVVQTRYIVEPDIVRLAAGRVTDEWAHRLIKANEDEAREPADISDRIGQIQLVHQLLAEMCGNRFLEIISKSMSYLTREIVEAVESEDVFLPQAGEHDHVIEVVIKGDQDEAEKQMRLHLKEFSSRMIKIEKAFWEKFEARRTA